jgi:hypothetical protein
MDLSAIRSRFCRFRCPSGPTSKVKFDGETIRQMGIAFEMALASLRATPAPNDPIRAALAQRIIALAKAGERDPERLCEGALRAVSPAGLSGGRDLAEGGPAAET